MSSKDEIKHESIEDCESVVKYLQALRDGFAKGSLVFSNDQQEVVLGPESLMKLEVKASKKNSSVKLSIKFEWKDNPSNRKEEEESLIIKSNA